MQFWTSNFYFIWIKYILTFKKNNKIVIGLRTEKGRKLNRVKGKEMAVVGSGFSGEIGEVSGQGLRNCPTAGDKKLGIFREWIK